MPKGIIAIRNVCGQYVYQVKILIKKIEITLKNVMKNHSYIFFRILFRNEYGEHIQLQRTFVG